ncbi:hypothetical protein FRC07_005587 [Ceratobasidium sp. 392]|nr:hypothetical protein FRC07_005587 [Ceratobasidium sp. 392]
MVASGDDSPDHPFWYAKVLGIYHTNVIRQGVAEVPIPRQMNFLWVRWMEIVEPGSWERCTMDCVQYVPKDSYREQFGFLDPELVIWACYLIPVFTLGRTTNLLGVGSFALDDAHEGDWRSYYVNRFVDRDMFMRYWGGGVGHLGAAMTNAPITVPAGDGDDEDGDMVDDIAEAHTAEDDGSSDGTAHTDDGFDDDWDLHASTD